MSQAGLPQKQTLNQGFQGTQLIWEEIPGNINRGVGKREREGPRINTGRDNEQAGYCCGQPASVPMGPQGECGLCLRMILPSPQSSCEAGLFSNVQPPLVEGCSRGHQLPSASSQVDSGGCLQEDAFSRYLVGEGAGRWAGTKVILELPHRINCHLV